ncbi:glycosyltransferase family 2 protein [Caecibacteroides pullorum]|uniref:Glycosyltransferase family 2 protein n=1 Tax=Caecibacteroides pullorum TaxID=2725562 RepID=A0AA40ZR26_9BACT|nr:glycosyltransferase family A protein [Caecibacteroides pullorum]MBM6856391.1 glycosyltransferase family 2 protein [Caecibacteroides pullorum]MBV8057398.1 glycosyltransferase family 2 protein [Caecibacteroides pullorum]
MKDFGLVSIITPTWNCARFIEKTIQSVQAQTYQNWEMIIVDDCSTDDTYEVVKPYIDKDNRIKYRCNEKNSGAAITRNNALKIAHGRWIAFLDSDDLWKSDKLEKQLSFMHNHSLCFSYTNYVEIDENSKELGVKVTGPQKINYFGMYAYCWPGCLTVIYDSSVVGLIQIEDIKKNNDYAMWLKVIRKARSCHLLNETLAFYRKRVGSISNHSYMSLIIWHYNLFREAEHRSIITSIFCVFINLCAGVLKKILFVKNYNTL